ncbi:MAG: D-alanyl-D-alanine carboxypeptidase [Pseudomonadota bacterium]
MARVLRCVVFGLMTVALAGLWTAPAHANSKYAAYVIHADSGDVLLDKYSNQYRYPASLTKMMTLYMLFEELEAGRLTLESKLKVSARAAGQPPSKLRVKSGSTIEVETAIKALVVKSANDVAVVIAENISGSEWKFAQAMTKKARQLGMRRTTFRNASGLPNRKQRTTARDLARLSQRVVQDFPQYYHFFSDKSFTWNGRTYRTHNALVKTFDGADGLKTGYTRMSGFNLATTATRDGHRLIGIVLGGRSGRTRDAHMRKILEQGFAQIRRKPSLVAALHREKPAPRLKPTLVAQLDPVAAAPTVASNEALRSEIAIAAASLTAGAQAREPLTQDAISALIASTAAVSDDFNEFERFRLASAFDAEPVAQGDIDTSSPLNWSVQIGAYSDKSLAQTELEVAAIAAGLTDRLRLVSPLTMKDGTTLFRARFAAIDEAEAVSMCAKIKAAKLKCFSLEERARAAQ